MTLRSDERIRKNYQDTTNDNQKESDKDRSRRLHGKDCTCYVCDWDDYWRHLGKQ